MAMSRGPEAGARLDDVERAHLINPADHSFAIARSPVADDLAGLARRFWLPVWDVPDGAAAPQAVLQYPVCLLVISHTYARFYGVTEGLSTTALEGRGWAVGLMLQPASGYLMTGQPVRVLTDRHVDLRSLERPGSTAAVRLVQEVTATMAGAPAHPGKQAEAHALVEDYLRRYLPVDDEGRLVNRLVEQVESSPELLRVTELCDRFAITERTLQRLLHKRVGIGPKWLIRRRRLQEAAQRLRDASAGLAMIAADLGYADQTHFTRDFRKATGMTPGEFAARFRTES